MIETIAPTFIKPLLSDLQISIENTMLGQDETLVDSQLLDTDVLVSMVRTKVKRVLFLGPRPFPYGAQSEYPQKETFEELTKVPERGTGAKPTRVYLTGMREQLVSRRKTS